MLHGMITQDSLLKATRALSETHRIIGPVAEDGHYFYRPVEDPAQLDLAFNFCTYSPREFLFPAEETLFTFNHGNGHFETHTVLDDRQMAFVGVHPCDINAIRLLDHVFSVDHPDAHYLTRRHNTLIIGVDCHTPCTEGVFCADMHGNRIDGGFDVMLFPLHNDEDERGYGVQFGTEAGRTCLNRSGGCLDPSSQERARYEAYVEERAAAFPRKLKTSFEDLPELLSRTYDSPLWEETAQRCYSCGSCNLVCPTCYCFNVVDETDMSLVAGERKREWDGCQLKSFAKVAGDHNFRPETASRLRHRIHRKAKWLREKTGLPGCVGCARCDRACTARINSVDIYNRLAEEVAS